MATNIIDPNDAIASKSLTNLGLNATPDYSDMFIFAELTAKRRKASIIDTEGVGKKRTLSDANDATVINMMGFDNETGSYTTRWTNNIGENRTPYEGFGMTKIDISMNSSYVPQIDIEFVDIRGLSLVNLGTKSKYSVLYSFPPPIFTLTIKGYYGKAISYDLHLVSQSTKFDAASGNFFINAKFVGQKYGKLTDVLFKYIDIVPLMDDSISISGENNSALTFEESNPPKNTRELITRAKKLYDDIDKIKVDSEEAIELDRIRKEITNIESLIDSLSLQSIINQLPSSYSNNIKYYINESDSGIMVTTASPVKQVNGVSDYNSIIKGLSPNQVDDLDKRLYILYEYDEKVNNQSNDLTFNSSLLVPNALYNGIISSFEGLKENLIKLIQPIKSDVKSSTIKIIKQNDIAPSNGKKYVGIDISVYYTEIRQLYVKNTTLYNETNKTLKDNINNLAKKNLGFLPTINNVFTVIANDVDVFYKKLRENCWKAETSHKIKINFDKIVSNNSSSSPTIAPYPLIIKNVPLDNSNKTRTNQRAYPGDPSLGFGDADFPEVDFVEGFINAFIKVIKSDKINNLKSSVDETGNYKWIPVNPLDSDVAIANGNYNTESPFKNKYNIESINKEILNRFYVSSQYSYGFLFYEIDAETIKEILDFFGTNLNNKNDGLVNYLAESEANNLLNSIIDLNLLNSLELQAGNWASNIDLFYQKLEEQETTDTNIHYSNFNDQIDPLYPSTNYVVLNENENLTISKNRLSPDFAGFELISKPKLRSSSDNNGSGSEGETNFVDKFIDNVGDDGFFNNIIFDDHGFDGFTIQNIPYVKDDKNSDDKFDSDFLSNRNTMLDSIPFLTTDAADDTIVTNLANSITNIGKDKMLQILNDTVISNEMKAYFIVGAMINTLSYFKGPVVNKKFAYPSVIEIPKFAHIYMGALTYFFKSDNLGNIYDPIVQPKIEYFVNKYGFGDLYNPSKIDAINIKKISDQDAERLEKYFDNFVNVLTNEDGFVYLNNKLIKLINDVALLGYLDNDDLNEQYIIRLEPKSEVKPNEDASVVVKTLMTTLYLLNYTQITFLPFYSSTLSGGLPSNTFTPLKSINQNSNQKLKRINDRYFTTFFKKVVELCKQKKDELNKLESSFREGIADNDIKTQTYYSFKAIADKWIIGLDNSDELPLIQDFQFVDKFFNDIGDKVMIDVRPLIEMSQDYDISVFSVLSRLLALNGFEFFPLQNFISFQQDEWVNSFKTYGSSRYVTKSQQPRYVCMYIGGTSSQLDDFSSGYEDDGFKDEAALLRSPDYNVDNVKGFKVNFAKQNQSMFTSIQLDTNEHKETNESLAILSELAKDQSASSPVPKGQNLFSTYEQRSYTCNVECLGNALIQPTQYFILENVPMFHGAYLILEVKHSIVPNSMKTNFKGVRVRSNSNPLVTEFSTSIGLESGDVNDIGALGENGANEPTSNLATDSFNPQPINDMNRILISP